MELTTGRGRDGPRVNSAILEGRAKSHYWIAHFSKRDHVLKGGDSTRRGRTEVNGRQSGFLAAALACAIDSAKEKEEAKEEDNRAVLRRANSLRSPRLATRRFDFCRNVVADQ